MDNISDQGYYTTLRARFIPGTQTMRLLQLNSLSPTLERLLSNGLYILAQQVVRPLCKQIIRVQAQHLHPGNAKSNHNRIYLCLLSNRFASAGQAREGSLS
jgi:hypothetical protein